MDRKVGEKLLGWTGRGKLIKLTNKNKKEKQKQKEKYRSSDEIEHMYCFLSQIFMFQLSSVSIDGLHTNPPSQAMQV
jgi:Na+/citrate or Na+/malate symporter